MNKMMVIGSISTDFVVTTDKRPEVGETITGTGFETTFGGKGANQAVASARLGADVYMVGTVGSDIFGKELLLNLTTNKIHTDYVEPVTYEPSGSAHITIADGDNSIVYIPGANNEIDTSRIQSLKEAIQFAQMVVVQNELPQEVVDEIIELCFESNVKVIYNPAPAREVQQSILEKATYFTPNESEFHQLFPDMTISEGLAKYPNQLILTMGSKGVYYHDGESEKQIPSYKVQPVDTTGAGDTFNGAFAVAISSGMSMDESIRFGNLAASLSIQKFGAQGGMPSLAEMKESEHFEKTWNIK
ncbi:ribokinase [Desemzia incerta]|uniref:Ribokinase n=1 Tax=Desemzia incerta TaxID=82801 RepID=A0A1I5YQT6_9LACT|nr:ribokinase [Desemzia incerta]SFQ46440.1 ribokinase [Desemzia incerta]